MKLKINLLIFCCTIAYASSAQWTVCPPNGISTNPDAPVNNQNSYFENDFFDWRLQDFNPYYDADWYNSMVSGWPTTNPYWSSNPEFDHISGYGDDESIIDYSPEEGWELIGRNLGRGLKDINNDGIGDIDPDLFETIYFILYNKYTGKLRYFYGINPAARDAGAQSYEVKFHFTTPTGTKIPTNVNGMLGVNGEVAQPLDQETSIFFVKGYAPNNLWWNHVDFAVGYDPCTCLKNGNGDLYNPTRLSFLPSTVTKGEMEMSGRLIGTVADPYFKDGNTDRYDGDEFLSVYDDGFDVSSVGLETFEGIDLLFDEVDTYNQSQDPVVNALYDLLSTGVSAFPVAEAGLKVFSDVLDDTDNKDKAKLIGASAKYASSLVGGLKTEKKVLPSIMDGEIALVGKKTSTKEIGDAKITYATPGTGDANTTEEFGHSTSPPSYPIYNEVLGRFAMLTTPTLKRQAISEMVSNGRINRSIYQLKEEDLEFLFNPALDINFDNTTIMASLIFEVEEGPAALPPNTNPVEGLSEIYTNDNGEVVYFSPFLPLECLGNTTYSIVNTFSPDISDQRRRTVQTVKNIYLRLMIYYEFQSLDRDGIPNADAQTITFPIQLENVGIVNLVNGLDGITATRTLNATNFTTSQDIQAFNTITVTGDLTAAAGVTVNLIANQIIIEPGASIGPGINISTGIPTPCGDVLPQSSINLVNYCTNGAYKANVLNNKRQPVDNSQEDVPQSETPDLIFRSSPNPFKEATRFSFYLPATSDVSITVYNTLGQEVNTLLVSTELPEGEYNYTLDGSHLPTGVYYATIRWNGGTKTLSIMKQ